jgi:hypothetical protein
MTPRLKLAAGSAGLILFLAALCALRLVWSNSWQHIHLGADTTFVNAPCHPDGTVDYIAALNARYGAGVTSANNAATIIHEVCYAEADATFAKEYAESLYTSAATRPAGTEACFISYNLYRRVRSASEVTKDIEAGWSDEIAALVISPWSPANHPEAAAWLAENSAALDRISLASRLPHYFAPLIRPSDTAPFLQARLAPVGSVRTLADALAVRAMHYLNASEVHAATEDALTIIRLGFLVGQQPSRLERLSALAIIDRGAEVLSTILATMPPASADADSLYEQLVSLGAVPTLVESIQWHDRFEALDLLTSLARFGPDAIGDSAETYSPAGPFAFGLTPVHFDPALREINQRVDHLVDAASRPSFAEREATLSAEFTTSRAREAILGASSQDGLVRLSLAIFDTDLRGAFRVYTRVAQILRMLQTALTAPAYFDRQAATTDTVAQWFASRVAAGEAISLYTGQPLSVQSRLGRLVITCEEPEPLPVSRAGITIVGVPAGPPAASDMVVAVKLK